MASPSIIKPATHLPPRGLPQRLRLSSSNVFWLAHIPCAKSLTAHGARDIGFTKKITDTPDFLSQTQSAYISRLHYYQSGANNNQIAWRFFLLLALSLLLAVQPVAGSAFTSAPAQKAQPRSRLPPPARSVACLSVAFWLASLAISAHQPSPLAPIRPSGAPRDYSCWRYLACSLLA